MKGTLTMKIIIKGKLYDTETAQKMLTLKEKWYWGDYIEELYKKKMVSFSCILPNKSNMIPAMEMPTTILIVFYPSTCSMKLIMTRSGTSFL